MITSKELAKMAGVSQSTVSRCLNNSSLVSEKTKKRILDLAREYNFTFNNAARSLKINRTNTIGYVFSKNFVSFTHNISQSTMFNKLRQRFAYYQLDLMPIFDNTYDNYGNKMSNIEQCIRNKKVDGLIIGRSSFEDEWIEMLDENKMPYIFIYEPDYEITYPYVIANNFRYNGEIVGEAFAKKGYKNIIEVLGMKGRLDVIRKHDGFVKALNRNNIELSEDNILYGTYDFESGYKICQKNIEKFRAAQACFVHNDTMALGVMKCLLEHNIKIPKDIAIIGHDNIEMSSWFFPKLTTVKVNYSRMSDICTQWMVELLNDNNLLRENRKIVVNGELIIRDTFR